MLAFDPLFAWSWPGRHMRRREFITLLSGVAAWPLAARAQQPAMPVIGFLSSTSPTAWAPYLTAFQQGLRETGYVEGQNVTIEYRWAEGDYARLPALAGDLVRRHVAVLVAVGGSSSAKAAKAASSTIPIVFTTGGDPVGLGLVASLNRPGGNVTGVALLIAEMESKRFGLLRDLVPTATLVAVLLNPRSPVSTTELNDVQQAARAVGQQIHILNASSEQEMDAAFANLAQLGAGALLVGSDPFFNSRRSYLVSLRREQRYEFAAANDADDALRSGPEHVGAFDEMVLAQGLGDEGRQASRDEEGESWRWRVVWP